MATGGAYPQNLGQEERNCCLFEAECCLTPRTRGICPKAAADAPKSNPGGLGILQFGANPTSHLRLPRLVGGDRPVIGKSLHTGQGWNGGDDQHGTDLIENAGVIAMCAWRKIRRDNCFHGQCGIHPWTF